MIEREIVNESKDKICENNRIVKLIVFHLVIMNGKNMLAATCNWVYQLNSALNIAIIAILLFYYSYVIMAEKMFQRIPYRLIIVTIALALFFVVSFLRYPDRLEDGIVRMQIRTFISYCFPLFVLCSYIKRPGAILEVLFEKTILLFIIASISFLFAVGAQNEDLDYSMSYGYSVLFVNSLLLYKYSFFKRRIDIVLYVLSGVYIVISGSRGPLVFMALVVLYVLFLENKKKWKYMSLSAISFVVLFSFLFYKDLIRFVAMMTQSLGLHIRSITLLANGMITNDTGRTAIHEALIDKINSHPIIGVGAFGGDFAHSIVLDTFANFGYLFGAIVLCGIVFFTITRIRLEMGTLNEQLYSLLLILAFGGVLFTGAFFESKELWMLIGILLSSHCKCDIHRNNIRSYSMEWKDVYGG